MYYINLCIIIFVVYSALCQINCTILVAIADYELFL